MATIEVRCPTDSAGRGRPSIVGCGHEFVVHLENCDDAVDCPACGLWFDPSNPANQPQPQGAVEGWTAHLARYNSETPVGEVLVDTVEPNERVRVEVRTHGDTALIDIDIDRQDGIDVPVIVSVNDEPVFGQPPDASTPDVDVAQEVDILFDGPPAAEAGRFIEVEDLAGHGVGVGEWIDRGDGTWALRVSVVGIRR